jgi:hypothetical protein
MKFSYRWRGLAGPPIHPPLTDATSGTHTFAVVYGMRVLGSAEGAGRALSPIPHTEEERAEGG